MKLIGWKRRLNGGKYGVGFGGPKLQFSFGSFSKWPFSLGIIYIFGGFWVHQDVAFVKAAMKP